MQIKTISESGLSQLVTDIEYFSNVLKAMGYVLPVQLSHVLEGLKMSLEELKKESDNEDEDIKNVIYKSILKMRHN